MAKLWEATAKQRLADEYDAAQERGEVAKIGDNLPSVEKHNELMRWMPHPTAAAAAAIGVAVAVASSDNNSHSSGTGTN